MTYSGFSLASVKKALNLTISPRQDLFSAVPALECSNHLTETLAYNVPFALASHTEKSRSEMIITPILLELTKQFPDRISFFSGSAFKMGNWAERSGGMGHGAWGMGHWALGNR